MTDLVTHTITKVGEFIEAFDANRDPDFWIKLMVEEANELVEAEEAVDELKEACDFLYVTAGHCYVTNSLGEFPEKHRELFSMATLRVCLLRSMGLSKDDLIEAFDRVHKSNMSKLGDDGKPIRREDGKIMKGPNYEPPYLDDLVE